MVSFNPFTLQDKTILVTGASSGIGRAIAIACFHMGGRVIITGRNRERLEETASFMSAETPILCGDLTVEAERREISSMLPALDGLVQCAGIGNRTLCKSVSSEDIDSVMASNFESPVLLQAELLQKKKIKREASIVFIASKAADFPSVGNAIYSASKGAIIAYAKVLALELAPRRIRVNCICPAMVWTNLIMQGGLTEEDLRVEENQYPLKRYGTPEDIANLSIFLLSEASSWMTGSCIDITGGSLKL